MIAAEGMAQTHVLRMQSLQTEQLAGGNQYLVLQQAMEHQAHIHLAQ
jgi:hypothetical protein